MSGGHFNYLQHQMWGAADEVRALIQQYDENPEVRQKFIEAMATITRGAAMLQRVDWLVSGDDGEESFISRWAEDLAQTQYNLDTLAEALNNRDPEKLNVGDNNGTL